MSNLLILRPTSIIEISSSRGSGIENLFTTDPQEAWVDDAVGSTVRIDVDFGEPVPIDTVFLGCISNAAAGATWTLRGGIDDYEQDTFKPDSLLRVPERPGQFSRVTHAFWHGTETLIRYLRIWLLQPVGASPLSIGVLMVGRAFSPEYNQEWGSGRGVKDSGTLTRLPSGGFSLVEGARYGTFKWALGDLTDAEVDDLYQLQLDRGETKRVLVVEDPDTAPGLRHRLHYGLFTGLQPYERRNPRQTKWAFTMEDLVVDAGADTGSIADFVLTLGGVPLTFGGELLTIGAPNA